MFAYICKYSFVIRVKIYIIYSTYFYIMQFMLITLLKVQYRFPFNF